MSSRRSQDRGRQQRARRRRRQTDLARSGRAARPPRAQGAHRSRGLAAARAAQEHAAAARFDLLRAHLRRRQLPRLRAEAGGRRPRDAARGGPQRAGRARRRRAGARRRCRARPAAVRASRSNARHPRCAPAAAPAGPGLAVGRAAPPRLPALAEPRVADGIREVRRLFQSAQNPPRWPMYIRQAKQFLRNVDASFDERKFGFASLVDLMRACQRDGLFRIERDRQGVMRIFPGNVMQAVSEPVTIERGRDRGERSAAISWTAPEPESAGARPPRSRGGPSPATRRSHGGPSRAHGGIVASRAGQRRGAGSGRRRRAPGDGGAAAGHRRREPSRSSRRPRTRRRKPRGRRPARRAHARRPTPPARREARRKAVRTPRHGRRAAEHEEGRRLTAES